MSDEFERRLSESLRRAADSADGATGLAQGARSRLRRRRRTTIAAAAAALVVVAVPVGIQVAGDGGGDGATVATDPSVDPPAGPAMRTESWRDATVQVPADWGYGSLSAWCASGKGDSPQPVVQRPTTIAPMISCSGPASSYGVQFVDARSSTMQSDEAVPSEVADGVDYPAGAWSGFKVVGGTIVQVVAPDEDAAMAIYESIALLEGPDANGCPQDLGQAEAGGGKGGKDISLCRYSDADELESSKLLPPSDSEQLLDEIASAPTVEFDASCDGPASDPTVILQDGGYLATLRTDDPCKERSGVFLSGVAHELTDVIRELTQMP